MGARGSKLMSAEVHGGNIWKTLEGNGSQWNYMEVTESFRNLEVVEVHGGNICKLVEVDGSRWNDMEVTGSFRNLWKFTKSKLVEVSGFIWKLLEVLELAEVSGSLPGYVEARGSFHQIRLCKLQLIEVMGSFRFHQQWKLPSTFICSTSMEVFICFHILTSTPTELRERFHLRQWSFAEFPNYFHGNFHQPPITSMEASIYLHTLASTSMHVGRNFHGIGWKQTETSTCFHSKTNYQVVWKTALVAIRAITVRASRSLPPTALAEGRLYFCTTKWEQGANWDRIRVGSRWGWCGFSYQNNGGVVYWDWSDNAFHPNALKH